MTPSAEIVEATTTEHLVQVRSLIRAYQSELPTPYRFPDEEWLNLPGEYAAPQGALLLATVAAQPAGCVGLRPFPLAGACEMKRLYVRPTFRAGKIGKALVERVVQEARALGFSRLRLDTHPSTMQTAVAMYRNLGFQEVVPDPADQVEGLLYMQLLL